MTRDPSSALTLVLAAIDPTTAVMLALGGALMVASWITSWRVWHGANIPARSSYSPRQQLELRRKLPAATTAGTAVVIGALTRDRLGPPIRGDGDRGLLRGRAERRGRHGQRGLAGTAAVGDPARPA